MIKLEPYTVSDKVVSWQYLCENEGAYYYSESIILIHLDRQLYFIITHRPELKLVPACHYWANETFKIIENFTLSILPSKLEDDE